MISSRDVVFCENIFKVSNKHITIATPPYVRSDTVFMNDLTNWTSSGEWKFTATSAKKKQHNTESVVSEREGRSQNPLTTR
jgi:hypothetical protein